MSTVNQNLDKEGNNESETEITNNLYEGTITKETKDSLYRENSKIFHNDTTENQYNYIESEMLKIAQ